MPVHHTPFYTDDSYIYSLNLHSCNPPVPTNLIHTCVDYTRTYTLTLVDNIVILYQYLINHHSNVCCLGYSYEETVYINYHFVVSFYFTFIY